MHMRVFFGRTFLIAAQVLRPTLSNEERQNFVSALEGMIGQDYNLVQVFDLIVRYYAVLCPTD